MYAAKKWIIVTVPHRLNILVTKFVNMLY